MICGSYKDEQCLLSRHVSNKLSMPLHNKQRSLASSSEIPGSRPAFIRG